MNHYQETPHAATRGRPSSLQNKNKAIDDVALEGGLVQEKGTRSNPSVVFAESSSVDCARLLKSQAGVASM